MTVSLEQRIQEFAKQVAEKNYLELNEAILDGMKLEDLGNLEFLTKMKSLEYLSLNHLGLKSLKPFPEGTAIQILHLQDNSLSNCWDSLLALKELKELELGGNEITSVKELQCLAKLTNLSYLGLQECPITQNADYRKELFAAIPSLEIVDLQDKEGNEVSISSPEDEFDSEEDSDDDDDSEDNDDDDDESGDDDDEDDDDSEDDSDEEADEDAKPAVKKAKRD